jgi:hypothetical protein
MLITFVAYLEQPVHADNPCQSQCAANYQSCVAEAGINYDECSLMPNQLMTPAFIALTAGTTAVSTTATPFTLSGKVPLKTAMTVVRTSVESKRQESTVST